jgi:hypothetical protein
MENLLVPIAGNSVSSDTSRKPGAVSLESEPRRNQLERSPCSSGRRDNWIFVRPGANSPIDSGVR